MRKFHTATLSVTGKRESNQDVCIAFQPGKNSYFLAVADGVGGSSNGELAAKLAIESVSEFLSLTFSEEQKPELLKAIITKCFDIAQQRISEEIKKDKVLNGMATTLTAVLIIDDKYVWGNIGDSRSYLLSAGAIHQITEDHTYIQDYLNKSLSKLPEFIINEYGNVVTKILDGGDDQPDIFPVNDDFSEAKEGDFFLLCSDGLIIDKTKDVSKTLLELIDTNKSLNKIAGDLVSWAFENGSKDNISVVLGSYGSIKKVRSQNNKYKTVLISTISNDEITDLS